MSDKPKHNQKDKSQQRPVKVIRLGAVAASIWRRQTSTGFEYLDFSLSRSWKLKNGEREGYSQNFFENNEEALLDVVSLAASFIRENSPQADEPGKVSKGNVVVGVDPGPQNQIAA